MPKTAADIALESLEGTIAHFSSNPGDGYVAKMNARQMAERVRASTMLRRGLITDDEIKRVAEAQAVMAHGAPASYVHRCSVYLRGIRYSEAAILIAAMKADK